VKGRGGGRFRAKTLPALCGINGVIEWLAFLLFAVILAGPVVVGPLVYWLVGKGHRVSKVLKVGALAAAALMLPPIVATALILFGSSGLQALWV